MPRFPTTLILVLVLAMMPVACAGSAPRGPDDEARIDIRLVLEPTQLPERFGPRLPQIAIWAVHGTTGEVRTVLVTRTVAHNDWRLGGIPRPMALPVWTGLGAPDASGHATATVPDGIDAVTAATPKGQQLDFTWRVPSAWRAAKLDVFVEINQPNDFNETWPEGAAYDTPAFSDMNGQPSLVWKTSVTAADTPNVDWEPELVGHGELLGRDHEVHTDLLDRVTTARDLVRALHVEFVP